MNECLKVRFRLGFRCRVVVLNITIISAMIVGCLLKRRLLYYGHEGAAAPAAAVDERHLDVVGASSLLKLLGWWRNTTLVKSLLTGFSSLVLQTGLWLEEVLQ